jgi:hypothetical protein
VADGHEERLPEDNDHSDSDSDQDHYEGSLSADRAFQLNGNPKEASRKFLAKAN